MSHASNRESVGVVEVGSRAVRLLVAEVSVDNKLRVVSSDWRECKLLPIVRIDSAALKEQFKAIKEISDRFVSKAHKLGVSTIKVFGTEALRRISREHPGLLPEVFPDLCVFDRRTEAFYSLIAAVKGLPAIRGKDRTVLVIDQGAGSLELVVGKACRGNVDLVSYRSYKLGTEALRQLLARNGGDISKLRRELKKRVSKYRTMDVHSAAIPIVLGSAATKLAWIKVRKEPGERYSPRRVHGQILDVGSLMGFLDIATRSEEAIRLLVDSRNPMGQEYETVVAGLAAISAFLTKLGESQFVVSGFGTRYGVAWSLAGARPGLQQRGHG